MIRVVGMRGIRRKGLGMGEASFIIKMGGIMMGNGSKIRCMDGGNYTMREGNWHMRVSGHMISSMAMGKYIMIILFLWKAVSIIQISICLMITGSSMKECLPTIQKRGGEESSSPTNKFSRETSTQIESKDSANFSEEMETLYRESGEILD